MFLRLVRILLITICTFNAVGVEGLFSCSSKMKSHVSISQNNSSSVAVNVALVSPVESGHQSSDQDHSNDCTDQHKSCHHCHLGHCSFILVEHAAFTDPDSVYARYTLDTHQYGSIALSGPRKPPRA